MPPTGSITQAQVLVTAMFVLLVLLVSVVAFMLSYLLWKNKRARRLRLWKKRADNIVWSVIFSEESEEIDQALPPQLGDWLDNALFRACLIDELLAAKKNLSGEAALNITKIYDRLGLDKDSERRMSSRKWHIKARGIQELALMGRIDKVGRIYRYTNNANEFIRMEAQIAIVQLYGFEGLRFLDVISQPISEWQQIKLLAHLPRLSEKPLEKAAGWLRSNNPSVVVFALKLAEMHRRYDLHDDVADCLRHRSPDVRVQAAKCLREIYDDRTPGVVIASYEDNPIAFQQDLLYTLGRIGDSTAVPFIAAALCHQENVIRVSAARSLMQIGREGADALDAFELAREAPWNEIIEQVKSEQRS